MTGDMYALVDKKDLSVVAVDTHDSIFGPFGIEEEWFEPGDEVQFNPKYDLDKLKPIPLTINSRAKIESAFKEGKKAYVEFIPQRAPAGYIREKGGALIPVDYTFYEPFSFNVRVEQKPN